MEYISCIDYIYIYMFIIYMYVLYHTLIYKHYIKLFKSTNGKIFCVVIAIRNVTANFFAFPPLFYQ